MTRITVNPKQMGGVPCIRGFRIPVATVVNMVAGGMTAQEIVDELAPLEIDDVSAALRFAADAVSDREIPQPSECPGRQRGSPRLAEQIREAGHDPVNTVEFGLERDDRRTARRPRALEVRLG